MARHRDAPSITATEFHQYSQHGEDGILLHLFDRVGTTDRTFVEIGIGDGTESCTANLAFTWGWRGALFEWDEDNAARASTLLSELPVSVTQAGITRENVNDLILEAGVEGSIDLFAIDIDGNDYWVWENTKVITPRVVAIEYNASWGATQSVTVPYDPTFQRSARVADGMYHGASLAALTKLGNELGYVLVGCDSSGVNAFFVDRGIAGGLPAVPVSEAWRPHAERSDRLSQTEQERLLRELPFVEV